MAIRAVTFDYGGTLDGPGSHWLDRFVAFYRDLGVTLPFERIKEAFYRADDAAYAEQGIAQCGLRELMVFHVGVQLDALGVDDGALRERLVDRFVAVSQTALRESRFVLEHLARRFRLGVISNFYGNLARILSDAGIEPLLSALLESSRLGISKPDGRIFELAVGKLGSRPEETLHVGDSYERDIVAAKNAGLKAAWLVGDSRPPASSVADLHLRSLDELIPYLDAD